MSAWPWLAAALGIGWFARALIEPKLLRVTRYRLSLPGWPSDYPALRVAFVSDFHTGMPHMSLSRLRQIVEKANAERPDVILLGGDYIDSKSVFRRPVRQAAVADALSGLQARLGVFAILGNHDWNLDGHTMWRELERVGIAVLENDARRIEADGRPLWIAGTADADTRTPDVPATLRRVRDAAPVLLLAHDPATFFDVPDRPALTLSGHTHGSQIFRLPLLGPTLIMSYAPLKWGYGHIVEKGRHLLVTGGLGTSGLPLRFMMRPEIVIVELTA